MRRLKTVAVALSAVAFAPATSAEAPPARNADVRTITASSTLEGNEPRYGAANLRDGDLASWCEGRPGDGVGETLSVTFATPVRIERIFVANGFGLSKFHQANGRVKELAVNGQVITLDRWFGLKPYALPQPIVADRLTLEIRSVLKGDRWQDTCLAEIAFEPRAWVVSELNPFGPLVYQQFDGDFPGGDVLTTHEKGTVAVGGGGCGDGPACAPKTYACKRTGPSTFQCAKGFALSIADGKLLVNGKPVEGP